MNKLVFASVISEIQQSDIFMTVKARICEAPAANLNGARVTEAFIDEIVSNEDRYVGLPLYADVRALVNGNYRRLGHLYDSKTGEFHSTQIGSFYQFEKEEFDGGCYLVGYARIAKRNRKLSKAISELFTDGALKFSFEVSVGEYEELDDDTILIDASDSNYLEGTAIVTFPACEDAVALELVAQKADDTEGGETEMAGIKKVAEQEEVSAENTEVTPDSTVETAEVSPENGEANTAVENAEVSTETAEDTAVNAEDSSQEESNEETAEESKETAEEEPAQKENAAVVIHETHLERQSTYAYDTESGVDVAQSITVETSVSHVDPEAQIVEADDGIHIAEEEVAETTIAEGEESGDAGAETPEETPAAETPSAADDDAAPAINEPASEKKTAEQLIAELTLAVESLRNEIAEMKETKSHNVIGEINPLMADLHSESKYSLLEKEEKPTKYTLLS